MERKFYDSAMESISKLFKRPYKAESIAVIWDDVKDEPNAAMTKTFYRAEVEFHPDMLVPISRIRDIILQEGRKIRDAEIVDREREAERTKAEERKPWAPPNDPHGKACAKFLQAAFSGMYSHDELRVMADEGEKKFPGRGFDVWLKGALKPKVVELKQRATGEAERGRG